MIQEIFSTERSSGQTLESSWYSLMGSWRFVDTVTFVSLVNALQRWVIPSTGDELSRFLELGLAERCSRINAKRPSESAVKVWFYKGRKYLQQTIVNARAFPVLCSHRILTLVSNCRNLRSALPSFSKTAAQTQWNPLSSLTRRWRFDVIFLFEYYEISL